MKKKVISILLTAVLATGMAACGSNSNTAGNSANNTADNAQNTAETSTESTGSADSAEKPVLTVGMEGTYAPYTYHEENGTLTGFEVDMANAIGEKMGYDVQFVETEWDSITAALDAGNFDVVMNQVTITDERKEKFDFSTPYIYSKPVLIVAADNTDINSFEDINGKKAAEGLTSNFSDIARSYGAEIVGQDKFALAMECVLSGEADCAINDELTYAYWKQQKGGEDSTKIVAETDNVNSSAIMVKKGNDELIEKLNSAIDELLADGTVKEISEKYFGMDVSQP